MDKKAVFDFRNYKAYLKHREDLAPNHGRGFRAELSRAAGCQSAYISQVLNGGANFSLEQAHALNPLLLHSKEEARFFLLLVELGRAATPDLKNHFSEIMNEEMLKQLNLKERFKLKPVLTVEDQTIYYSEWSYAAIHIGVTVSKIATVQALTDFFQLPKIKVQKILRFLVSINLIVEEAGGQFKAGTARIHLSRDSGLIAKHHTNWRLQAMNSFERETERDLHYTSVVSLSEEDVMAIKTRLVKEIDAYNAIVAPSAEETVYCLTMDFFSLERG